MKSNFSHPAVYIPPPVIGIVIFLFSTGTQKLLSIPHDNLHHVAFKIAGWTLMIISLFFGISAVLLFFKTHNTVETFKPATSLQTAGAYRISRNPMYVGLVSLYSSLALLAGNWWTILFIPVFVLILQVYVIRREEKYLEHTFGEEYSIYKHRVNRWLGKKKKAFHTGEYGKPENNTPNENIKTQSSKSKFQGN